MSQDSEMKHDGKNDADAPPQFTVDDHLRVQFQIEQRAHELWVLGGFRQGVSFDDWLQAEREIIERFVRARSSDDRRPRGLPEPPVLKKRPNHQFATAGSDTDKLYKWRSHNE